MKIYGLILIVISAIALFSGLSDAKNAETKEDKLEIMIVGSLFVAYIVYILITMNYV